MSFYQTVRTFERGIEKGIKRILNVNKFKFSENEIRKYKNFYDGKRCFIIGNGPSLTIEDLNTLKNANEICIASNSIYNLFDKTEWRPTIYTVHDFQEIKKTREKISQVEADLKIIAQSASGRVYDLRGGYNLKLIDPFKGGKTVFFSDDISKCIYDGGTVTYVSIQCAVYLGFKEIVLLGVDHSFALEKHNDGTIQNNSVKNHFTDYQTKEFWGNNKTDEEAVIFPIDFATLAFEVAKKYADENKIKIFNATRGGKLEVFERVNFNEIVH